MTATPLTFDRSKHLYRLNGIPIPSVTQVMEPLSRHKYDGIDQETMKAAADRGTNVHEAIELFAKYGVKECEDSNRNYFEAFLKWNDKYRPEIINSEMMTWHPQMIYAGTVDMLARINGQKYLIDFKTTASLNDMLTTVQLEAYYRAMVQQGFTCDKKAILQLKQDGSYVFKVYETNDLEAWKTFTSLLTVRAHIIKYGG